MGAHSLPDGGACESATLADCTPPVAWHSGGRTWLVEVSRATCHATSSAPQVHLRHRVVRAFDGTHTITCAQRQQQLSRLLAMKDGVRRPVTLMDRRGLPLDARSADSSPARGSAHASSRIGSRDPAAARHWSAAAGRCLWRPASSLEPAQVVDGRLYG